MTKEPIHVCVTGAAGQIAYSLLYSICKGDVFGQDQPIILHLLGITVITPVIGVLGGVCMELVDCAFPLLEQVIQTVSEEVAFKNVSAAFLVGAMPRRPGMERYDLLAANVKIFKSQGQALDKFAKRDVKVLVVGNPANTNACICAKYAPSLSPRQFTAMTRLDQTRAQAQIAKKIGCSVQNVSNVIIWGNHSSTQFPDASHAMCNGKPVLDQVDKAFLQSELITIVQKRGQAVMAARKLSSAMSASKAAGDHMRDWFFGTKPGSFVSMGVISDGSYGAPKNIVFSFPVTINNGEWKIVLGLKLDDFAKNMLEVSGKELEEELNDALLVCKD